MPHILHRPRSCAESLRLNNERMSIGCLGQSNQKVE